jgi:hypothetical protein
VYSSPSTIRMIKSRRMRRAGRVVRTREKSNAYRMLVGNPEGKRPLGRPRRRWVHNIKMDLKVILYLSILMHSISHTLTLPSNVTIYFSHIYSRAQHVSALISHHQVRYILRKVLDGFDIIAVVH